MAEMSVNALKNNLTNPARDYLWEVIFASPLGGDTNTLLLRARSSIIPGRSVGNIHIPFKQTGGVEYPGKLTFSHNWTCTFVEGEDAKMWKAFYDWAQKIINTETGIGNFSIKTDIYLNLLNTDGSSRMKIKIVGAFIKEAADITFDYVSDKEINIATTWSYDYWVQD